MLAIGEESFRHSEELAAARRREVDFTDLQNEIAGRETGRAKRFLTGGTAEATRNAKKNAGKDIELSALDLLMRDPEYAALYKETKDLLITAEQAAERALESLENQITELRGSLVEMRERANKLPDGRLVFKDEQGRVWTEDGQRVEGMALEQIVWKEGAPSREEFQAKEADLAAAEAHATRIRVYQVEVLAKARERLHDERNPPAKEEVKQLQSEMQKGLVEVIPQFSNTNSMQHAGMQTNVALPNLGG